MKLKDELMSSDNLINYFELENVKLDFKKLGLLNVKQKLVMSMNNENKDKIILELLKCDMKMEELTKRMARINNIIDKRRDQLFDDYIGKDIKKLLIDDDDY